MSLLSGRSRKRDTSCSIDWMVTGGLVVLAWVEARVSPVSVLTPVAACVWLDSKSEPVAEFISPEPQAVRPRHNNKTMTARTATALA